MATIAPTIKPTWRGASAGAFAQLTLTTLAGGDTFNYVKGTGQILVLLNPTGGAISPVIVGAGTTWNTDGAGAKSISAGYAAFSIAAGQIKLIPLDTMEGFLQGAIVINSSAGLKAALINPVA